MIPEPICDMILFGLLVWVCYNTVVLIRDGWRDFNRTFPRVYPGDREGL